MEEGERDLERLKQILEKFVVSNPLLRPSLLSNIISVLGLRGKKKYIYNKNKNNMQS